MILMIDNYDSFTYNLVQYFGELKAQVEVFRNDALTIAQIRKMKPAKIVISPGPGRPEDAGISIEILKQLGPQIPVLGVCLGHQGIGYAYGGKVINAKRLMHGKTSMIKHNSQGIFKGLPNPFEATRYHSLVIDPKHVPDCLTVTATTTDDGEIMGVQHKSYPIYGVQFHPESILTKQGMNILKNFLPPVMRDYILQIEQGENLSHDEITVVMELIMSGQVPLEEIKKFLLAINKKGPTVEEITASALIMRKFVVPVKTHHEIILDTCGTGGDHKDTFNISTVAAIVVSACGIAVAKHGNRSVSSKCGSADVLEALGINVYMEEKYLSECLNKIGLAFLFAQRMHPAMKNVAFARKELGVKTIFNILGPLTNPAQATHQIMGVYSRDLLEPMTQVLRNLGLKRALVVHGNDGLDEITTTDKTFVSEFNGKEIISYDIDPDELGVARANIEDLAGGNVAYNAALARGILDGELGHRRNIVVVNTAYALYTAQAVENLQQGMRMAEHAIDSKRALQKLEELKEFTNSVR